MPKVSAIIITYNRPVEILARAILSVINQTYKDIEILIVNDAPENTELSAQIKSMIKTFGDDRISYLSYEKNQGSNYARNYGLNHCKGEFVAFLDDDDEWLPEKTKKQLDCFSDNPNIAIVYSGFLSIGEEIQSEKKPYHIKKSCIEEILADNFIGSTSFPMMRTECVKKVGGFDVAQKACQEHDLWIRLIEKYELACLEGVYGKYYLSKDSTFKSKQKFYDATLRIEEKHKLLYQQYPKAHHKMIINVMIAMIKASNYKLAFLCKIRAWKVDFFNLDNILPVMLIRRKIKRLSRVK